MKINDAQSIEMIKVIKIITKYSALFYSRACNHRNEKLYVPNKFKECVNVVV